MKIIQKLMIAAMILAVLVNTAACNSNSVETKQTTTAQTASSNGQTSESVKQTSESSESEYPLGDISFERQKISKTLKYDPEGTEQILSLTDKAGTTWTLILPPGVLLESREITMTALSNIKCEKLGDVLTGVELLPDGLEFLEPVEIRVENSSLDSGDIILSSDGNGQNLDFAEMSGSTTLQAKIYHFSNKFALPRSSTLDNILLKAAELSIQIAIARAEELLGKPIDFPTPPAVALPEKCNEEEQKQKEVSDAVEQYTKEFKKPELEIIRNIISAMNVYEEIARQSYDPEYTEVKKVVARIHKKCDKVIAAYQPQDKYYLPVGVAVISTQREIATFADGESRDYFEAIANWGVKVIEQYIGDIRDKHLYSKAYPVLWLGRQVSIIGGGSLPWDFGSKLFYRLGRVLNFNVEFTTKLTGPGMEFAIEGKIPSISIDVTDTSGFYRGEGEGAYTKAVIEEEGVSVKQPNKFPVRSILYNFYPCHSDNFNILITAFGPANDTYIASGYPQTVAGIVNSTAGILFQDFMVYDAAFLSAAKETVLFDFEIQLRDGEEIAGERRLNESVQEMNVEYKIKLVHKPLKTTGE